MNWENIFNALDKPESFLAIILLLLAFILGMIFTWIWLGGRIKDVRKTLEGEQLKNSSLLGKNAELEDEAKIHLADANRIKIENREMVTQHDTLLQEKDQLYSQVMMASESEASLKDQLDEINSRYIMMENRCEKLSTSLTKTTSDFETSVAQKDALNSRVAELEATNQNLQETRVRENATYTTQLSSLQESINHLRTEHTIAKNDLVAKTAELDLLKSQYLSMKNEYDASVSSHANIATDSDSKATVLEKQQDTIDSLLVKQTQYIADLESAKADVNGFKAVASDIENKKLSMVYNSQILSVEEALEAANQNLTTLKAEKAKTNEELQKLQIEDKTQEEDNTATTSNDSNIAYSSLDDSNEISLAVELNVVKKQLKAEHQARIEQQQEADKWRAALITLKTDLAQTEENRAKEQEKFLNELAELKENHQKTLQLKTQSLLDATTKVEELEAKLIANDTTANNANDDIVHLETSQNNELIDIEAGVTTDEVKLQEISATKEQIDALNTQIDEAEAKIVELETKLNDAESANISLKEQLEAAKMKTASSVPTSGINAVNNTTTTEVLDSNARMDASVVEEEMDSFHATNALKKLIGTEIPATANPKDNLKTIKGIGKHIEKGLNYLGINSFQQVSSLNDKHIQLIRRALDIFPGRIEQDNWVGQAKKTYKNNVELTPETAKLAVQDLFGHKIPVAKEEAKDDLKLIKGIGGFLEKQLNDIGIYTFKQISVFDKDTIEKITIAIEFFPGRIKRDKWVKQAKELM